MLVFYDESYKKCLEDYQLTDDRYTSHTLSSIKQMKLSALYHPVLLVKDERVLAYLVLDQGEDKYCYTSEKKSLLLRSLSVDEGYRGQGLAREFLQELPDFIRQHFPEAKEIVLGANVANQPAVALYRKLDWEEKEDFYQGAYGAQRIFRKELKKGYDTSE